MVPRRQLHEQHDGPPFALRATWSVGMRTTAWDRLWRVILSDLGPQTSGGLDEQIESEGDDA